MGLNVILRRLLCRRDEGGVSARHNEPELCLLHVHATTLNLGDQALSAALYHLFGGVDLSVHEMVNEPVPDFPFLDSAITGHPLNRPDFCRMLRTLARVDAVVIGGGDVLLADIGPYLLMRAARLLGVPVYCVGVGVNLSGCSPYVRRWVEMELPWIELFMVRDPDSERRLHELGVSPQRIRPVPDLAFSLPAEHFDVSPGLRLPTKPFVAVSVRAPEGNSQQWGDHAWHELAAALDRIIEKHDLDVLFLPMLNHARDRSRRLTHTTDNDEIVSRIVAGYMTHACRTTIVSRNLDYREAVALLARARLTVGTRLHSLIFSTLAGTPMVGLSYNLKTDAFLRDTVHPDCRLEMAGLSRDDVVKAVDRIVAEHTVLSEQLRCRRDELRDRAATYRELPASIEPREHALSAGACMQAWSVWSLVHLRRQAARVVDHLRRQLAPAPPGRRRSAPPARGKVMLFAPYFAPAYYGGAVQVYHQLFSRLSGLETVIVSDLERTSAEAVRRHDHRDDLRYRVRRIGRLRYHAHGRRGVALVLDAGRFLGVTLNRIVRLLRDEKPDVVVCGETYALGWLLWWLPRSVRLVNYVHGEEVTRCAQGGLLTWLQRLGQRLVLRRADLTVVVSDFTCHEVRRRIRLDGRHLVVLPNAVDTRRFRPSQDRLRERRELGWDERFTFLTVSRLCRRKGIDQALCALAELHHDDCLPADWQYVIGGTGTHGEVLHQLSRALGIEDHVQFAGFVPDEKLPLLYRSADLFLLPNIDVDGDTEGFGLAFVEAAACGTPVIGGRAGGTGNAIIEGVTGIRVDARRVDLVKRSILEMLDHPERRRLMARRAPVAVRRRFSLDRQSRCFTRLMTDMVGRSRTG